MSAACGCLANAMCSPNSACVEKILTCDDPNSNAAQSARPVARWPKGAVGHRQGAHAAWAWNRIGRNKNRTLTPSEAKSLVSQLLIIGFTSAYRCGSACPTGDDIANSMRLRNTELSRSWNTIWRADSTDGQAAQEVAGAAAQTSACAHAAMPRTRPLPATAGFDACGWGGNGRRECSLGRSSTTNRSHCGDGLAAKHPVVDIRGVEPENVLELVQLPLVHGWYAGVREGAEDEVNLEPARAAAGEQDRFRE